MGSINSSNLGKSILKTGWKARLEVDLVEKKKKTIIRDLKYFGPLRIQKPFYPEANGRCHIYILHPPGGVVGGDQIEVQINVATNAKVLITTPAAGKFYRSAGSVACQIQEIKVASEGILEWFPSENIFYSGAKVKLRTKIVLMEGCHFLGWDICCLGRPASDERFINGSLDQRVEIWLENKPIRLERIFIQEKDPVLKAKWGLANKPVLGSLVCFTPRSDLIEILRQEIKGEDKGCLFSTTFVDGIILCRYLGDNVEQARRLFVKIWKILRFKLLDEQVVVPRIWNS